MDDKKNNRSPLE